MYSFGKDFFDETEIQSLLENFLKQKQKQNQQTNQTVIQQKEEDTFVQ